MNFLNLIVAGLGVLGGLFAIGVTVIPLITMWACAVHMRQCEERDG